MNRGMQIGLLLSFLLLFLWAIDARNKRIKCIVKNGIENCK